MKSIFQDGKKKINSKIEKNHIINWPRPTLLKDSRKKINRKKIIIFWWQKLLSMTQKTRCLKKDYFDRINYVATYASLKNKTKLKEKLFKL
jgi:hypothetical protein